ncbi:MAG: glycogen debranching N-terminal domain-containing protein [Micromonosporaceae bacterium]
MAGGWTFSGEPVRVGGGAVTLVEGSSFCLSDPGGDIEPGAAQGLFFRDTRILSGWRLRLDSEPVEPLTVLRHEPYRATFLGRAMPGRAAPALLVERSRFVGAGMREDIVVRNLGGEPAKVTLSLRAEADFADLFEVKEARVSGNAHHAAAHSGGGLCLSRRWREHSRGIRILADVAPAQPTGDAFVFDIAVPARGEWRARVLFLPIVDGAEIPTSFPLDQPLGQTGPATRTRTWREAGPRIVTGDGAVNVTLLRSHGDLGSLRIFEPGRMPMLAAGAPWFMALFGRDSILASMMALPADPALALGTAQALAGHQGREVDPRTEEEPGRIPHELRMGLDASLALGGNVYYGSIDSTPLFVMLLAELRRWGAQRAQVEALIPHADRAMEWIERYGDADGDGFVEYERATGRGLVNQGWKDSSDAITFAGGAVARPPIALAEVQGYVYAAYLGRALLAEDARDAGGARHWRDRAARLKRSFNERFWLPERGWYALGLDGGKRPVDALASNMGHCLWTGIADADKAARAAEMLMAEEMWSGWGIRTLASGMGAYNPMSYHNGSVWPHDNAIAAAGLMRYGWSEQARRVASGVLGAAAEFGGQLPELICGFGRGDYPAPVPYPTSSAPQAWAAATPFCLIWTLLGAQLCVPHGRLRLAPSIPPGWGGVCAEGLRIAGASVRIEVREGAVSVDGLPEGIELTREPCTCHAVS